MQGNTVDVRQSEDGQEEGMELRKSGPLAMKQILCEEHILGHKRVSPVFNLSETIFYLNSPAVAWGRGSGAQSESPILSKRIPRWEISCLWKENKIHSHCWCQRGIQHHLTGTSMRPSSRSDIYSICHWCLMLRKTWAVGSLTEGSAVLE